MHLPIQQSATYNGWLATGVGPVVDQSTNNPEFKGSNPPATGTG